MATQERQEVIGVHKLEPEWLARLADVNEQRCFDLDGPRDFAIVESHVERVHLRIQLKSNLHSGHLVPNHCHHDDVLSECRIFANLVDDTKTGSVGRTTLGAESTCRLLLESVSVTDHSLDLG